VKYKETIVDSAAVSYFMYDHNSAYNNVALSTIGIAVGITVVVIIIYELKIKIILDFCF
jgi:hypothetical protein